MRNASPEAAMMKDMKAELTTLYKAIKAKCLDCSGGEQKNIAKGRVTYCSLYPLRPITPQSKKKGGTK